MKAPVRIGMITPSSNTCLEPVTAQVMHGLEDMVSIHYSRLPVTEISLRDDSRDQFSTRPMVDAARLLADAEVDVIVWNGTSGSWLGLDQDHALCDEITQATGIPATTSTLALFEAFRIYDTATIGLAVPYTNDVTDRIVDTYREAGIACQSRDQLAITRNSAIDDVPPDAVRECLRASSSETAEAIAVVCTNMRGAPHVPEVEAQLGIPVFDSVTTSLWSGLQLANAQLPVLGWGSLLEGGWLRAELQRELSELLVRTGASRTTVRLDLPALHLDVDAVSAESVARGVPSIRRDRSIDQWNLETVRWLADRHTMLVQPGFDEAPRAPQALIDVYGVRAQVLLPILLHDRMIGWVSIHSTTEREWDADTLSTARESIEQIRTHLQRIDALYPIGDQKPEQVPADTTGKV